MENLQLANFAFPRDIVSKLCLRAANRPSFCTTSPDVEYLSLDLSSGHTENQLPKKQTRISNIFAEKPW